MKQYEVQQQLITGFWCIIEKETGETVEIEGEPATFPDEETAHHNREHLQITEWVNTLGDAVIELQNQLELLKISNDMIVKRLNADLDFNNNN